MGTAANLLVVQGDKKLGLHTSHDGFTDTVFCNIAPHVALLGLDLLRARFAAATVLDESEVGFSYGERTQRFREAAISYAELCDEVGVAPFNFDELLDIRYGIRDFTSGAGGLLYSKTHVHDAGFFNEGEPLEESSDFILDLDAGTLLVNYGKYWAIDLAELSGKDPQAVLDFLGVFDFDDPDTPGINRQNALSQDYNQELNEELRGLPARDVSTPAPVKSALSSMPAVRSGGGMAHSSQMTIFRFHPDDLFLVRLLSQTIQRVAEDPMAPDAMKALAGELMVERANEHCGLVIKEVSPSLVPLFNSLGEYVAQALSSQVVHLGQGGGLQLFNSGFSSIAFCSSFHTGDGTPEEFSENDMFAGYSPDPASLSSPFTPEHRKKVRATMLDIVKNGEGDKHESAIAMLRSEASIALVSLDPNASALLFDPALAEVLGPPDEYAKMLGVCKLIVDFMKIECFLRSSYTESANIAVRDRFNAMPEHVKDAILSNLDRIDQHDFMSILGTEVPRKSRRP